MAQAHENRRKDGVSPQTDELSSALKGHAFDVLAAGFQKGAGTGDFMCRSQECYFHTITLLFYHQYTTKADKCTIGTEKLTS